MLTVPVVSWIRKLSRTHTNTDSMVVAVRKESRRRRDGTVVRFVGCNVRVACVGRLKVFGEQR
jgi:hypothetical protein